MWISDAGFMWASHFNHWMRVSYVEPRVWVSTLWHFPCLHDIDHVFFFLQRGILWVLRRREITLVTLTVLTNGLFSLRKTTFTFIGTNNERQARLTGNYSESQSFFSEMISKRARRICTTEIISGFVRFGPSWSIIGFHLDNVGHDAPVWSQIFPSLILFKEVTTTSTMRLKVTKKRTSLVQFWILSSPILFKEVTTTNMMRLKVTGKRTSLVQFWVLSSPILFKEVTTTNLMRLKVTGKRISLVQF